MRLGAAVRAILFPHLEAKGFTHTADAARDFSGFHRLRADGGYDLVEIQFDKRSQPFFFINLGIAPADGVTLPQLGRIAAADLHIYHLSIQGRLRKKFAVSMLRRWLSPDTVCDDIARDAAACFDVAEKWFAQPEKPPACIAVHDYSDVVAKMQNSTQAD